MRTTMITRPSAPKPASTARSKLSPMMQTGILHAKTAGIPPLTYLARLTIPDDRLAAWRDALHEMPRADLTSVAYWAHHYLGMWAFGKAENREGFIVRTIDAIRNWECRELEIVEAFEQLLRNEKRTRDEGGQIVITKLRDNPEWHPTWDQIVDALEAAQKRFAAILGKLNRLVREAEQRALGLRHTDGERRAIAAIRDRLSDAENHALDWQDYLADRPARREAFVNTYRREAAEAAQAVNDATAALRYFTGKPGEGEAQARERLARLQDKYDRARAALRESEAILAKLAAERRQALDAPRKLIERPR
jgi:hypothetical protein